MMVMSLLQCPNFQSLSPGFCPEAAGVANSTDLSVHLYYIYREYDTRSLLVMETHASGGSEVIISHKSRPLSDFRLRQITSGQDHLAYNPVWVDIWHLRLREQHGQHSFQYLKSISTFILDH